MRKGVSAMPVILEEKPVSEALFSFIFPFSLEHKCQNQLMEKLLEEGFHPFRLSDTSLEDRFYGEGRRVSHRNMNRYFLSFTNHVVFPGDDHPESFRRLSKTLDTEASLISPYKTHRFRIHSVDMLLCPFDTGFLTLRTELIPEDISFTDAVEFADRFRSLKDSNRLDRESYITYGEKKLEEIDDFLLQEIVPQITPFLLKTPMENQEFDQLPFVMDDRMFVLACYRFPEDMDIEPAELYRAARVDGIDDLGRPAISASHIPYIQDYCRQYGYERWAPHVYFMTDEHCFCCLSKEPADESMITFSRMNGEYYYGLLLNLFHRIVLLKLSNAYSQVQVERKEEETVELIRDITTFSAKYNFGEVVSQNSGRELYNQLRRVYGIDDLFKDVKETLNDLFQYQESRHRRQSGYLLTILTIYAVVSGIYGMNQVIEDLKGHVDWSVLHGYSVFEWISFCVAMSGLGVGALLVANIVWKWTREWIRARTR
jgi:hypothetical protein